MSVYGIWDAIHKDRIVNHHDLIAKSVSLISGDLL